MALAPKAPRSVTKVKASVDALKALTDYLEEMRLYRENRNRPNNELHYLCQLTEELGQASEAAVAIGGSTAKLKKFKAEGVNPKERLTDSLAGLINSALLCAEQNGIVPEDILRRGTERMNKKRNGNG